MSAKPNSIDANLSGGAAAAGQSTPLPTQPVLSRVFGDRRLLSLISLVSVVAVIALWQWGAGHVSGFLLPPPAEVLGRFLDPKWLSRLMGALGQSLVQLALGFGLTHCCRPARYRGRPLADFEANGRTCGQRALCHPAGRLVPFLVIWFGLFLEARVMLVFIMSFFDVLVIIIAGARDVRKGLVDVGRSFGAPHTTNLRLIVLPALLPFFFAALRVGSARAINGMITAELFLAAVNLGAIMKRATRTSTAPPCSRSFCSSARSD